MNLLRETADAILGKPDPWPDLEEAGLTTIGIGEGTPGEAALVLARSAWHAAPIPLAETCFLAAPLLAAAGLPVPAGPLTVVIADPTETERLTTGNVRVLGRGVRLSGGKLHGSAPRVPWGSTARIVVLADGKVALAAPTEVKPGRNLAGEPRDTVTFRAVRVDAVHSPLEAADLRLAGALARSVQIMGAAQRVLAMTTEYAGQREQFGRPIGGFQAVQQQLATLAGEVAVLTASVGAAVRSGGDPVAVAAAKVNAGRAAGVVAEIGHQVHGAIGATHEHPLRLSTLRLLSWREEYGAESFWAADLGARVAAAGGPWPLITGL